MSFIEFAANNLLSPPILCFLLGACATFLRSDLKLPEQVFAALSIFLMLSIGLQGGAKLAASPMAELALPLAGALALGCLIPLWCYLILRRWAGLSVADAAALAAHYGSVSAVTFAAVGQFLTRQNISYEGFAPALLAVMEVPAVAIAVGLAGIASMTSRSIEINAGGAALIGSPQATWKPSGLTPVLIEVLSSKSIVLLAGGMLIGASVGTQGLTHIKPFFVDLFPGVLCLFLLDLGRVAASHAGEFRAVGLRLAAFALVMPVFHAAVGVGMGWAVGLSYGGSVLLGTLAASASYIVAPAAVRLALPEANPGYYLTCSLAITFPFNIVAGIPVYSAMARVLYA